MGKVEPYHSSSPLDDQVYHDHDDCSVGSKIPDRNREPGTQGFQRCGECYELDQPSG